MTAVLPVSSQEVLIGKIWVGVLKAAIDTRRFKWGTIMSQSSLNPYSKRLIYFLEIT